MFQPWMALASTISPIAMVIIVWIILWRERCHDREERIRWQADMDGWRQTLDQRLGAIEENLREIRAAVSFRVPRDKEN